MVQASIVSRAAQAGAVVEPAAPAEFLPENRLHGVDSDQLLALRDELHRLFAGALEGGPDMSIVSLAKHQIIIEELQALHDAATALAASEHSADLASTRDRHALELANLQAAMKTRDVIGQAKGIIMVTMSCNGDEAFGLLIAQSQAENRKLVEIAREIAGRVHRRWPPQTERNKQFEEMT